MIFRNCVDRKIICFKKSLISNIIFNCLNKHPSKNHSKLKNFHSSQYLFISHISFDFYSKITYFMILFFLHSFLKYFTLFSSNARSITTIVIFNERNFILNTTRLLTKKYFHFYYFYPFHIFPRIIFDIKSNKKRMFS